MRISLLGAVLAMACGAMAIAAGCRASDFIGTDTNPSSPSPGSTHDSGRTEGPVATEDIATAMIRDGRDVFRYDTFGSEQFWGGKLRLHESIAKITPREALKLGLRVD